MVCALSQQLAEACDGKRPQEFADEIQRELVPFLLILSARADSDPDPVSRASTELHAEAVLRLLMSARLRDAHAANRGMNGVAAC